MKYLRRLIPILLISLFSCGEPVEQDIPKESDASKEERQVDLDLLSKIKIFKALPSSANDINIANIQEKIKLGHHLYFDNNLSKDKNISCNSCHNLATFGVDNLPLSPGDAGELGERNSPTVLNAALHTSQFWDGRAKDVEEQAGMPILSPEEMAIPNEGYLVDRLKQMDSYKELFKKAFPEMSEPITYENLQIAIGAFERELITPSKFDSYLKGKRKALSLKEKRGLSVFLNTGCQTCHAGALLGGDNFQKFGVYGDYWEFTKSEKIDKGKAQVTKNEMDEYFFKTPSLRNVEKTAPYFHDGSVKDLREAIKIMAKIQLNKELAEQEIDDLIAFLKTLTSEVPGVFQKAPVN